ncbi:MAG: hypothetical protein PF636_08315 [Actinomycetota bacterium]|jgi:hypothetical protein|nr:hypothetical protein [Actinomycetota bacterium]
MADCECLGGCLFFDDRMAKMPSMAELYKRKYCQADNSDCARFMVFQVLGRDAVPVNLFPNDVDRATKILAAPAV